MKHWTGIAIVLLGLSGCATVQEPLRSHLSGPSGEVADCARWVQALDRQIESAGVRDGGELRISGFPYLRVDRFLASFRNAVNDEAASKAWTLRLRGLDRLARAAELRNLPQSSVEKLGADREAIAARMESCADILMAHDLWRPDGMRRIVDRAQVPDDYVTWQRALGLYAFTRLPFSLGAEDWQRDAVEKFRRSAAGELSFGRLNQYSPPASSDGDDARTIFERTPVDALGVPTFAADDLERLFALYAPVIEVEHGGGHDEIGALAWHIGVSPAVDVSKPTIYRKLAYTRHGSETLVQLVYVGWFSERPQRNFLDMLAGRLDGIVWRVTLDRHGEPLIYDTIHPCGCFHMFFPAEGVEPLPAPSKLIEWAFVPFPAPRLATGETVRVRLQSRTHYMVGLGADDPSGQGQAYRFVDYDTLRSLPQDGGFRSVFQPDGLIAGTQRRERAFFWPMGVPSAGAMRQWGRHATAFLGRRHFDDANLIESRFSLRGQVSHIPIKAPPAQTRSPPD
ncbi:MAG: hypothetical protein ABL878_02825 [Burkholderiales bacterium]